MINHRYKVIKEIGRGRSRVFLCYDILNKINVSVKVLSHKRSESEKENFRNEYFVLRTLKKVSYYFQDIIADMRNTLAELFDYFLLSKMENILDSYPHELSIGMAQRVALIFGFISKAKLLLLDEPNSALDLPISNLLSKKLIEHSREKLTAIVFTTQDINFAIKTADKIILIKNSGYLEYDNPSADQQQLKTSLIDNLN